MDVDQVEADVRGPELEPQAQPMQSRPRWQGSMMWLVACLGGGGFLIAALLAWGRWEFGSLGNTLAYLNGQRLLAAPNVLSFGTARRGEERILQVTLLNRTGKTVALPGARSTCGCMGIEVQFPIVIMQGDRCKLTVRVWPTGKDSAFEGRIDFYADDESNPAIPVLVHGTITD